MYPTKNSRLLLIVAGGIFTLLFLSYLNHENSVTDASVGLKRVLPSRLIIPKINIDAKIEVVGLTPEGAMGAPKNPSHAGWYDQSAIPGQDGTAVIDGHFGWKNSVPAIFDNIHKLRTGDRIYAEDNNGSFSSFIVRESRTYDEKDDASSVFESKDDKSHLNLITCGGIWIKTEQSYSHRLVVFADKVEE